MSEDTNDDNVLSSTTEESVSFKTLMEQVDQLFKEAAPNMSTKQNMILQDIKRSIHDSTMYIATKTKTEVKEKIKKAKIEAFAEAQRIIKKSNGVLKCIQKQSNMKDLFNVHLHVVQEKFAVATLEHEKRFWIALKPNRRLGKEKLRDELDIVKFEAKHHMEMKELEVKKFNEELLDNNE